MKFPVELSATASSTEVRESYLVNCVVLLVHKTLSYIVTYTELM